MTPQTLPEPRAASLEFGETEAEFVDPKSGITLSGTLTTPAGKARLPAVVFAHGSGPLDRDETFVGHKPFRVMAHHLAQSGIASLRFDKRGVGRSGGDFATATVGDFADDVLAAATHLRAVGLVNPDNVGLVGHSEGGIVALTAASRSSRVALCVLLASPVLPGRENVARLLAMLANGSFDRDEAFERHTAQLRTLLDLVRREADPTRNRAALDIATPLAELIVTPRTSVMFGGRSQLSGEELVELLSSDCFASSLNWDPEPVVSSVGCPVLALYGGKDVQVPAKENIEAARRVFQSAETDDFTVQEIPGTNHLFQRCHTGMPDEYASLDHAISDGVLERIASWILSRTVVSEPS